MLHNVYSTVRSRIKSLLVKSLWKYDYQDLVRSLERAGIVPGDVLMIHASWLPDNGFAGTPKQFLDAVKEVVTPSGCLVMPSLPYQNESSREFLQRGGAVKIRTSPSKMGLLSEVFRRGKSTLRSLSPTHPLLAWGDPADEFISGHMNTQYPFGEESPFAKLAPMKAKILVIDAPFNNITYNHYLEHRIQQHLAAELYDKEVYTGKVIDSQGKEHSVPVRVLAADSANLRIDDRLEKWMQKHGVISAFKLGNTRFTLLNCRDMISSVDTIAAQQLL